MRRLVLAALALPAFAGFFASAPTAGPAFAAAAVAPTFTVPQCLVASAGQNLMADNSSPDDCLYGTTGGPL